MSEQKVAETKTELSYNLTTINADYIIETLYNKVYGTVPNTMFYRFKIDEATYNEVVNDLTGKELTKGLVVNSIDDVTMFISGKMFFAKFFKKYGSEVDVVLGDSERGITPDDLTSVENLQIALRSLDENYIVFKRLGIILRFRNSFEAISGGFGMQKNKVVVFHGEQSLLNFQNDPQFTEAEKKSMKDSFEAAFKDPTRDSSYIASISIGMMPNMSNVNEELLEFLRDVTNMSLSCPMLIKNITQPKEISKVHLLTVQNGQLSLSEKHIAAPTLDVNVQYNDDFKPIHDVITTKLDEPGTGLILMHGNPGTGKTTYLKHLMHTHGSNRRVIYLPPNMAEALTSPEFMTFLMNYPGSILVIEDAENALKDRKVAGSTSAVSNLLNISDGILGDVLRIQIITTFNCDVSLIDKALMRKGRLICKYEFGPLVEPKAKILAASLGKDESLVKGDMTLADIYNITDDSYVQKRTAIGFINKEEKENV